MTSSNDLTPEINYRFWHEYYPVAKKKFVGVLPEEVKDFHSAETTEMLKVVDPNGKYLFIGSGDGREVEPAIEKGAEIWGLDYVESVVDEFNEKFSDNPKVNSKLGIGQDLPFEEGEFDGVFMLYNNLSVLGDRAPLLEEIKRILKPGGFLFGTVYNEHAKDVQVESYKGLDMDYHTHDEKSVTVIAANGVTYTSERFSEQRLRGVFGEVSWDIDLYPLTEVSWKYVAKK